MKQYEMDAFVGVHRLEHESNYNVMSRELTERARDKQLESTDILAERASERAHPCCTDTFDRTFFSLAAKLPRNSCASSTKDAQLLLSSDVPGFFTVAHSISSAALRKLSLSLKTTPPSTM